MKNLIIKTYVLGDLQTNSYLLWDANTLTAALIDPADSGDFLSEEIIRNNLNLEKIILTHGHFDHVLGLLEVKLNFPEALIYLHQDDLFLLKQAPQSAKHWLNRQVDPVPLPDIQLDHNQESLALANQKFQIIFTPGHTPGSISLFCPEESILFSGDTIFKQAVGRTDFRYSDPQLLQKSVKKLLNFPSSTAILAGHGEPTSVAAEKANFDFD